VTEYGNQRDYPGPNQPNYPPQQPPAYPPQQYSVQPPPQQYGQQQSPYPQQQYGQPYGDPSRQPYNQPYGQPVPGSPPPPYRVYPSGHEPPPLPGKRGHPVRWIFGGIAAVVVLIIIIAIALSGGGSGTNPPAANPDASRAAAASATGATTGTKTTPPAKPASGRTLLTTHGSGIKKTAKFSTGDDWTIHWTYDCSSFGQKGNFQIFVYTGNSPSDVAANELGNKGSDSSPEYGSSGTHYLEVNSECKWTLKVTQP
jgi:hypothetical protein